MMKLEFGCKDCAYRATVDGENTVISPQTTELANSHYLNTGHNQGFWIVGTEGIAQAWIANRNDIVWPANTPEEFKHIKPSDTFCALVFPAISTSKGVIDPNIIVGK